ncbi:MAG: hypothetical protein HY547_08965 [Elusimicrobia bacterium]|nr:hypothetical protein [Elusimicrobiota bacterium]
MLTGKNKEERFRECDTERLALRVFNFTTLQIKEFGDGRVRIGYRYDASIPPLAKALVP